MLTQYQRAVLAHVLVDPAGWYDHVRQTFGNARAGEVLAAGDTARVAITVNGEGADNVDVWGSANPATFFSASLML